MNAARSEKGLNRAADKRCARWRKIAQEASEQSRRTRLPEIHPAVSLAAALAVEGDCRLMLDEAEQARTIGSALPAHRVVLLVGPEGGWTDSERSSAATHGWTPVGLGHTILRTETAAIAGIAAVMMRR